MTAPVKEAQLTTVTLSEEAEKRLAIKTEAVAQRAVPRTRTIGGEIVAPSGTALAITAPVAGTLQAASVDSHRRAVRDRAARRSSAWCRSNPRSATPPSMRSRPSTSATARRDAADSKVQRAERLVKDGSVSRRSLEEAQAELAVADAELKAARDRVALATRSGTSSGGVDIEAPETAIVQNVHVRAGQTVAAGTPLIDLVRLTTVWVRVPVYAGEANDIDTSAPAEVQVLGEAADAAGVSDAADSGAAVRERHHRRRRSLLRPAQSRQSFPPRRARRGPPARAASRRPASSSPKRRCCTTPTAARGCTSSGSRASMSVNAWSSPTSRATSRCCRRDPRPARASSPTARRSCSASSSARESRRP